MMSMEPLHPLEAPLPERPIYAERRELLAVRILQVGAVAVVLAASAYKSFELDRYFVPKELTLHLTALVVGLLALRVARPLRFTRVDALLALYLLLSLVSAALATNVWLGGRAVAVTASGIALFWAARALARAGLARPIIAALALAVVVGAITSLLQTYGVRSDFFSLNRVPGGTLGNRNFIAHLAAFGLPVVLLGALDSRRLGRYLLAALGASLVVAVLVLTRSRAGWLALAGVLAVFMAALVLSPPLRRSGRTWGRLAGLVVLAAAAVMGAIFTPNHLRWNSDNPYLESVKSVANYQEGSGRGRLVQYRRSLRMALRHPVLGVGPGNWAVEYPAYAARRDPSLGNSDVGTTANPWPSSDWIASASERGLIATAALTLVFLGIALRTLRRLRRAVEREDALRDTALLATLVAVTIAGTFDAVLLLALPTLLTWTALGALWPRAADAPVPSRRFALALALVALLAGAGAVRSGSQVVAMAIQGNTGRPLWLRAASRIDPGNYRLHLRLARPGSGLSRKGRCEHARAARALYPLARVPQNLSRGCR